MKARELIEAHRLLADWDRTDPQADVTNAYAMAYLSVVPAASQAELDKRSRHLETIVERQRARATATLDELGVDDDQKATLQVLMRQVADMTTTTTLRAVVDYLRNAQAIPVGL